MYIAIFELLIFLFGKILGGDPPATPPHVPTAMW